MTKVRRSKSRAGGRPPSKDERRSAAINFRTSPTLKALAERVARSEGRSLANFLERLIWDGCREGLSRATPYQAAGESKIPAMECDVGHALMLEAK
jgi:hypothetical protein